MQDLSWRQEVRADDIIAIRNLTANTRFFSTEEISVAVELVEEKLQKGDACSYQFLFLQDNQNVIAYSCYGLIPFTDQRFDLYWIAVDPKRQGLGIGQKVLAYSEELIKKQGGEQIYIETSSRPLYEPTRRFYIRNDYQQLTLLQDFYRTGDSKIIYGKKI